jgi:hypothetical protein
MKLLNQRENAYAFMHECTILTWSRRSLPSLSSVALFHALFCGPFPSLSTIVFHRRFTPSHLTAVSHRRSSLTFHRRSS